MINLLIETSITTDNRQYCHGAINCSYLRYIGSTAYCTLFGNKRLSRHKENLSALRCKECKEAEDRYTLYEQDKAYRSPFYQVED